MGIKVAKERAICREHHFRLERGNLLSKAAHFQLHQLPRAVTQAVPTVPATSRGEEAHARKSAFLQT